MRKNHTFTDFAYNLYFSPIKTSKCVEVTFLMDGEAARRFLFIHERPNIDYIEEAKKIIKKELENDQLVK